MSNSNTLPRWRKPRTYGRCRRKSRLGVLLLGLQRRNFLLLRLFIFIFFFLFSCVQPSPQLHSSLPDKGTRIFTPSTIPSFSYCPRAANPSLGTLICKFRVKPCCSRGVGVVLHLSKWKARTVHLPSLPFRLMLMGLWFKESCRHSNIFPTSSPASNASHGLISLSETPSRPFIEASTNFVALQGLRSRRPNGCRTLRQARDPRLHQNREPHL